MSHKTRHDVSAHHQESHKINLLEQIKDNTNSINVNVDTLEVNTDGLETLITATNDKLDTFSGHSNNTTSIGDGSTQLRVLPLGYNQSAGQVRSLLCDSAGHQQIDCVSSALPSGASTEAKQDTAIGHLATVAGAITGTEMQVDVLTMPTVAVTLAGGATEAKQDSGITHLATIAGDTTSIDGKITACNTSAVTISASALPSGASTASLQGGGLPSALSSDNLKVSLKETITVPVSNTTLTNLNNCIDTNELQVDIVSSALPSGASTESSLSSLNGKVTQGYDLQIASGGSGLQQNLIYGRDNSGNLDALKTDASGHLEVVVDDFVKGQVAMSASFPVTLASDQSNLNVAIASGGFDGAVTNAGLTALDAVIGTDNSTGPAKCISIGGTNPLGGSIQEIAVDADGHLQVDILSSALPSGASGEISNTVIATKTTLATSAEIKELLSNATVNQATLSAELDTEHYERIRLFGETSASVGSDIKIFGSNVSGGTYYYLNNGDLMATSLTVSGLGTAHYIGGSFENIPRYIKIFNNSGSTNHTFTKLYMVGSGGRLAV